MIPKKIHYCWFGGKPLPKMAQKCIASWKKYCPDYEIIQWNEENFDVNQNPYLKYCYENGKWAFLSDLARLMILEEEGGIYFDTDVELIQNPDELLTDEAFFGFETAEYVASGLGFGTIAHGTAIRAMLQEYESQMSEEPEMIGCPILNTKALHRLGLIADGSLQIVAGAKIYPVDFFNPYDAPMGQLNKTKNTISIHWYSASWLSPGRRLRSVLGRPMHRLFGRDMLRRKS